MSTEGQRALWFLVLAACAGSPPEESATEPTETGDTGTTELPDYDCSEDYAALTADLDTVDVGDSLPSSLVVFGPRACLTLLTSQNETVVASSRAGDGRLVVFGHEGYLGGQSEDSTRLLQNAARWAGGGVVGLSPDLSGTRAPLEAAGLTVVDASPLDLSDVDVYVSMTYGPFSESETEALRTFVAEGGGLLLGGHAWWWANDNDNAADNYPGNKLLRDAGIVITEAPAWGGPKTASTEVPSDRFHHARAMDRMLEVHEGTLDWSREEQRDAVVTVGRALDWLPLSRSDFYDVASIYSDAIGPVTPTEASTVRPETQVPASLAARIQSSFYARLPAESIESYPAVADFPGAVATDAPRTATEVVVSGSGQGVDGRYWYSGPGAPILHSTGRYVPAGELIRVTVPTALVDSGATLQIGAHSDTLWHLEEWTRFPAVVRIEPIEAVTETIASAFGGLLYLRLPDGIEAGEVTLSIQGTVDAAEHGPWAEVEADGIVLTARGEAVRAVPDSTALIAHWNSVMAQATALDGTERARTERIVLDRQISAGWLHSGYPIMGHNASEGELLDLDVIAADGAWGPFHELGHNFQWGPWLLPGTDETTCNLWSIYISDTVLGIPASQAHTALEPTERAERLQAYLDGGAKLADWSVWTALETYLQLEEAFGWELFTETFERYRTMTPAEEPDTDPERFDTWVEVTSEVAGVDLGPFYVAWGLPVSADVLERTSLLPVWEDDPMAASR